MRLWIFNVIIVVPFVLFTNVECFEASQRDTERRMHPRFDFKAQRLHKRAMPMLSFDPAKSEEEYSDYWNNIGQNILQEQLATKTRFNTNQAKNVIFFLGDGLSIPTITAGRVYLGGEEQQFSFEKFPYTGLSKTYCANTQVADSACTATAYLCGVKANYATIGVSAATELNNCEAQNNTKLHVSSLAAWAQHFGMATGLITTTAVTHASPAGIYAHVANRNWENDAEILADHGDPLVCADIATQLVNSKVGRNLNVIFGGGRTHFLPKSVKDISGKNGSRLEKKNLIKEWQNIHGAESAYVQTRDEMLELSETTKHVLGLFASNHMDFHLDADAKQQPTLAEMVASALKILERQPHDKGYFLFVEGGRIDHAHHETLAMKALDETAEFDKAIALAHSQTNSDNTLILVTSDHSHTMSLAGYSSRKNDIFGINNGQLASDQLPYATLSYANGPGYENNFQLLNGARRRKNLRMTNMKHKDYRFPTMVPLESETHGGDDVAVFASGPYAHLFTGVYEQNFIPHAIRYAACLGYKNTKCAENMQGLLGIS